MGQRPLTGYHVYAFTIPMLVLHLPYVMGVDWTLAGELRTIAIYFVLAVVWDYLWFVLNPAYTVQPLPARQRLVVRGPVDLALPARLLPEHGCCRSRSPDCAALADDDAEPLRRHLWMLARPGGARRDHGAAGAALSPLVPAHAPRRRGRSRRRRRTYPPPAPDAVWSGGMPDLHPLESSGPQDTLARRRGRRR